MTDDEDTYSWKPVMSHGDAIRAGKLRKLDEAMVGRQWEIVQEVHLPEGQVFMTEYGGRGRHGYILRDVETGERIVVGRKMLRTIHDRYNSVALPYKTRRSRKRQEQQSLLFLE